MSFDFGEKFKLDRDRELRRAILESLYLSRSSPRGGLSGRAIVKLIASSQVSELSFEDDGHAMALFRDLLNKHLIAETRLTRLKHQSFGPDYVILCITDKGSMLNRREIAADPDIADDRAVE
jgi:hypothetical protein